MAMELDMTRTTSLWKTDTAPAQEARPVRVLLVEDDEDDYRLTRELLAEIGEGRFLLDRVASYQDAVEAVAQREHDVYLVDYRLGQHDGLELLRHPALQGRPVIMLTGLDDPDVDRRAMAAGAADYLVKGRIDAPLLERSIRYAIQRKRSEEALRRAHDELEHRVQERTAELERSNEALREADHRKNEFLAMLAHELRNPLAPLRNGLHILRLARTKADAATAEKALAIMEKQVHHITRFVDDLLDVSRITRGKIQLHSEPVRLETAIGHALEAVRLLSEARQHRLTVVLPRQPVLLSADPTRLEQVFVNMLHNAIKYTQPGGFISLTAEREGSEVIIQVRDTGTGMTPELLPRIFDLFTQAERTLDRSEGGLGIGLTMVKQLVELHGGSVEAHSEGPGMGSEFVVRLPALVPPHAATALPPNPPAPPGLRVLIVEDVPDVAQTLMMLVQMWGHDVRAVYDGPSALIAFRTYQPDVLLCDIGLPGMDGYAVARQLRREQGAARPLLAAVTGYSAEEDKRRSHEAGFDFHMAKPVDPTALEKLLAGARQTPVRSCSA
jgi:signal transduction histidine kinase